MPSTPSVADQNTDKFPIAAHAPTLEPIKPSESPAPPRDTSPESLAKIRSSYQKVIDQVAADLDSQAHFVTYQKPAMIAFRKGAYLEFSLTTTLAANVSGSRYKMAALAFDEHVAHLIHPMMAYLKGDLEFDGIAFSSTIHLQSKSPSTQGNEAVEFFFSTAALRCYEAYDCTGQELIDRGSTLINGE